MDYKNYQNARDAVWEIILKENITQLPVKVVKLCANMGIPVKLYKSADKNSGETAKINGNPVIFVNEDDYPSRQRFTVAHELGHIILGHVGRFDLINREPSSDDNPIEQAANVFASRLLAPACVLWGCGVRSADDIMKLCGIGKQAAEYRMQRMSELYLRNKFLTSPLERKVYEQFKDYILNNKL